MSTPILCADIGSTWTKAALISIDGPRVVRSAAVPTTQHDLGEGLRRLACDLLGLDPAASLAEGASRATIRFTSSAKGGLAIAAVGLVPDLTVHVARLAAASAGGKVVARYAYRLTEEQVRELERLAPDIVLLCGGTDGGDEAHVLANAAALGRSSLTCAFLYAGNAAAAGGVRRALVGRDLGVAPNVMPEIGRLEIEPARELIREAFLRRIVEGRGLAGVRDATGCEPKPTPLAVWELMAAVASERPDGDELCLVDLGGATTDVYSSTESFREAEGVFLRGIREPRLTRTVEGDLGMRVSARAAAASAATTIDRLLAARRLERRGFDAWVERVAEQPATLPASAEERSLDDVLAAACLAHALLRHAGSLEETWTPQGRAFIQRGKDLRGVRRIVAGGGHLCRLASALLITEALATAAGASGGRALLPLQAAAAADRGNLAPLLGSLAADHPREAAALLLDGLEPLGPACRKGDCR